MLAYKHTLLSPGPAIHGLGLDRTPISRARAQLLGSWGLVTSTAEMLEQAESSHPETQRLVTTHSPRCDFTPR